MGNGRTAAGSRSVSPGSSAGGLMGKSEGGERLSAGSQRGMGGSPSPLLLFLPHLLVVRLPFSEPRFGSTPFSFLWSNGDKASALGILAEWSKALLSGSSLNWREFKSRRCHILFAKIRNTLTQTPPPQALGSDLPTRRSHARNLVVVRLQPLPLKLSIPPHSSVALAAKEAHPDLVVIVQRKSSIRVQHILVSLPNIPPTLP